MPAVYDFRKIEEKFQMIWDAENTFKIEYDLSKPKFYVLEMFPYPSGNLHCGHLRNYLLGDVTARFYRAIGFNVLYTIGWDSFGLPAENAAMQNNTHPNTWTMQNIAAMRGQLKRIGLSYDWSRELVTSSPEYYKHEQKFFIEMLESGMAYRKKSTVNWDPVDQTVLANEQVIDGKGWRSGAVIEKKELFQWFLNITNYAEDLLSEIDNLEHWPESVKSMQKQWINKSVGVKIRFNIVDSDKCLFVFTTRAETLYGCSFCAIAIDHPLAKELQKSNNDIDNFIHEVCAFQDNPNNKHSDKKMGIDTGLCVQHPLIDNKTIPIYIANFVLMNYGTGAVFACPAHDERDFAFAKQYEIEILPVVCKKSGENPDISHHAFTEEGIMFNSPLVDGLSVKKAREKMVEILVERDVAEKKINYQLRDWGISRQRYWGCPIPVIHCRECGIVPVPVENLPILLPEDISFDKGNPLDSHPTWKHTTCPKCAGKSIRETDTFDTFFESSWYFAAFCGHNEGINKELCDYFLPVDCYIGGIEHAILHLLYARFFTRVLKKLGYLKIEEPFIKLLTQGMICHATYKDSSGKWLSPKEAEDLMSKGEKVIVGRSEKMSKSKKNVVPPEDIINKYGSDTVRFFMLSDTPPEKDMEWSDEGIQNTEKFLIKLWNIILKTYESTCADTEKTQSADVSDYRKELHNIVHKFMSEIRTSSFNRAIAKIYELYSLFVKASNASDRVFIDEFIEMFLRILEPIIPHFASELWELTGHNSLLSLEKWPKIDESLLLSDDIKIPVQINGKLKSVITVKKDTSKEEVERLSLNEVKEKINGEIKKVIVVPNKVVNIVVTK